MPRLHKSRRRQKSQLQSPLLRLPPEIRNQIYRLVLVHNEPLDLWPHKWTDSKLPTDSGSPTGSRLRTGGLKVRHQESIEYIRKEMATGLLGTCTQVFNEASGLFWSENRFRFSGRSGWQGLLRFFLTIGPEARARIQKIDVHAPIYMRWPEKDTDKKDMNGRSKNFPKMHMAKIPQEGHLDRQAIQRVCVLLAQDRTLQELNFLIPAQFRNGDETSFSGYVEDHDNDAVNGRLRLQRIESLDWIRKTLVVEKDGYLAVDDGPQKLMELGWDLVCQPGSFIWERGLPPVDKSGDGGSSSSSSSSSSAEFSKQEVIAQRTWRNPLRDLDYLDGVRDLFLEDEGVSVHANGGRHRGRNNHRGQGRGRERGVIKLERELKGFGPVECEGDEDGDESKGKSEMLKGKEKEEEEEMTAPSPPPSPPESWHTFPHHFLPLSMTYWFLRRPEEWSLHALI